jgi:hypothetical protein
MVRALCAVLGLDEALHRPFHHPHSRFLGYYALSLLFSAKRVPTLIDLRHVHLKTAKYQFYQHINYVLENTPSSLVLLDRLLSAEFVTSRQNFDTPGNYGASHRFGVSPASS